MTECLFLPQISHFGKINGCPIEYLQRLPEKALGIIMATQR
jgi:hypothetical protein